jgi:lipoate-protein ligase A
MPPLRLLPSSCQAGDWQMATDAWLLGQDAPSFRLYSWARPTLSLGFHQRSIEAHWSDLARAGVIDLVRRPSGGRAVLHGGDITYGLVWPGAPLERQRAYGLACRWLLEAFAELGHPLQAGTQTATMQRSNCFASGTPADLIHADGAKRIGSAQLWRRGCLLQHGSILINPAADLWQLVFGCPPPRLAPLPIGGSALESLLVQSALRWLPAATAGTIERPLSSAERAQIGAGLGNYREGLWEGSAAVSLLASPEASIDRTT